MSRIITFTGRAGCGKDETTKAIKAELESRGKKVLWLAYGDYIKAVCARNWGYDETEKEKHRHKLIEFGTEEVRECDEYAWIKVVFVLINALGGMYDYYLISDARFGEEADCIQFSTNPCDHVINVFVERDHLTPLDNANYHHKTELMANNPEYDKYDMVIQNTGTLDELREKCNKQVQLIDTGVFDFKELRQNLA